VQRVQDVRLDAFTLHSRRLHGPHTA
jgi:hypothetical protein